MQHPHIKVGKDVLESLTTSMYEDHRSIYREYIQNSCDQIDQAVRLNILTSIDSGEIHISINPSTRTVEIYDNATGVKASDVYSILGNIALSNKDRSNERGFRGIGRLAGLGYCEELIFETSYKGENQKSIMSWDAKKFKKIINDRKHKEEATTVIESIINEKVEDENTEEHYFKVVLKNVTNDELLDINNIREYLSMVAPLPMKSHFIYKNTIEEELKKVNLTIDEYNIYVEGEQIFKAYGSDIKDKNNRIIDKIYDISFIETYDTNNNILCWGWYGVSNFEGALTQNNIFRGLRLRKGNIQIGLENTLNKLHKEGRGNNYFIGEIHAFHDELIPNARRDYFSENERHKEFEKELKNIFYNKLYKLYYKASSIRSETKKIKSYNAIQEEFNEKKEEGIFENKEELKKYEQEIEKKKIEANKAKEKLGRISSDADDDILNIINRTSSEIILEDIVDTETILDIKPTYRTQKEYAKYDKKTQKLISKIYGVIDGVLSKDLSENLKQKIQEELN
ncbi:MAG: ATP-binding protein [Epsilonproteobacteria bacterium]|nr:MAG: ATP-binding protein [Campylobacterota bacterium]